MCIRDSTISHLRFGKKPIKSTYFVSKADFVACHNPSYVDKYDMVSDVKPGGIFLLNCSWDADELEARLPAAMKRYIAKNDIKFYTIDATHLAKGLGLGLSLIHICPGTDFIYGAAGTPNCAVPGS